MPLSSRQYNGYCDVCDRTITISLDDDHLESGEYRTRAWCRDCGQIVACRSSIEDGETTLTDSQRYQSPLLARPDEVDCWFPTHHEDREEA